MKLHLSRFVLCIELAGDRVVLIDALRGDRLVLSSDAAAIAQAFAGGCEVTAAVAALAGNTGLEPEVLNGAIAALLERQVLVTSPEASEGEARALLHAYARDPVSQATADRELDRGDYWAVRHARRPGDLAAGSRQQRRLHVLLVGDCDVHLEADFLEAEALARSIALSVTTGGVEQAGGEFDAIIVGALPARRTVALGSVSDHAGDPAGLYLLECESVIAELRQAADCAIVVDNLPSPSVQPLGRAERGRFGHRNRFRAANLALADMVERLSDVWIADVDSALARGAAGHLLDDALTDFTHFGSTGWLLQRPKFELGAVHGIALRLDSLASACGGDAYRRERAMAREHLDILQVALGIGRIKCLVVDLDGVLWPGVLAETGAPFAWRPDVSSPHGQIGVWFGIHEALKALQRRGVVLAYASRNDEGLVRSLWQYGPSCPRERLLLPGDFAAGRIGWGSKADAIRAISVELGIAFEAMAFVDDNPRERADVGAAFPCMPIFGEDIATLRATLLHDPRLMPAMVSAEAGLRGASPARSRARAGLAVDGAAAGPDTDLQRHLEIEATADPDELARAGEIFERTTQFNLTGQTFSRTALARLGAGGNIVICRYRDRHGDEGIVGAAVIEGEVLHNLAVSCRVAGLAIDHALLTWLTQQHAAAHGKMVAHYHPTSRNMPIGGLLPSAGFVAAGDGAWIRHHWEELPV